MPNLFYDIIILAVLLVCVLLGYHKGFILTLCGFLAIFVAFLGGLFFANQLAEPVGALIEPIVETSITEFLSANSSAALLMDSPELLLEEMKESAFLQGFAETLEESIAAGQADFVDGTVHAISTVVSRELARIVLFFICFLLVLIAWVLLSQTLNLAFKLPVLSSINAWGGAALGLLKGGLLVFIAVWFLRNGFLSQSALSDTYLLPFFYNNSPLSLINDLLPAAFTAL